MFNVDVNSNIVNVLNNGIFVGRDNKSKVDMSSNRCSNNTVVFNTVGSSYGIQFENQNLGKCDGNIIKPVISFKGSTGIKVITGNKCTVNNNTVQKVTRGIDLSYDINSVSNNNILENCKNGYKLNASTKTVINSELSDVTTAFEIYNGKTTAATKCRAFNCDFEGVKNIKNGVGISVWSISSALPVTGVWETGDRIIIETPTAGGVSEWVYVKGSFKSTKTLK
jgi:hypothetical protein